MRSSPYDVSWWYRVAFFVSYTKLKLVGLTHADRDLLVGRNGWIEHDLDLSRILPEQLGKE